MPIALLIAPRRRVRSETGSARQVRARASRYRNNADNCARERGSMGIMGMEKTLRKRRSGVSEGDMRICGARRIELTLDLGGFERSVLLIGAREGTVRDE